MARRTTNNGQASNRKASRKRTQGRSLPGWVWGLSGLAVGLFVALLVHLNGERTGSGDIDRLFQHARQEGGSASTGSREQGSASAEESGNGKKPRFEFYKLLPQQHVEVPEDKSAGQANAGRDEAPAPEASHEAPSDSESAATSNTQQYLLQAGSFHDYADADRLKATIALLGVEASIQKVRLSGGETWHRVRIGPFASRDKVNEVRRRLKAHQVNTILLKRGD